MVTDWEGRGGKVQMMPPIDLNKEHVFELIEVKVEDHVQTKWGFKDRVKMVWQEVADKPHKVWVQFNESYNMKSGLVQFLLKVSPHPELIHDDADILLGTHLAVGMQIVAFVKARIDSQSGKPSGYYDFIAESIHSIKGTRPVSSPAQPAQPTHRPSADAPATDRELVLHAMLICKGCANLNDAVTRLNRAGSPMGVMTAFMEADQRGEIKYPI